MFDAWLKHTIDVYRDASQAYGPAGDGASPLGITFSESKLLSVKASGAGTITVKNVGATVTEDFVFSKAGSRLGAKDFDNIDEVVTGGLTVTILAADRLGHTKPDSQKVFDSIKVFFYKSDKARILTQAGEFIPADGVIMSRDEILPGDVIEFEGEMYSASVVNMGFDKNGVHHYETKVLIVKSGIHNI